MDTSMIEHFLTEGARRALQRAAQWAEQTHARQLDPSHLVWTLWKEESRAAEIMLEHGMTAEVLERFCPQSPSDVRQDDLHATLEQTEQKRSKQRTIPPGEAYREVLMEARRHVAQAGRHAEIGSEHLLWGLAAVDSPVADLLRQYGLGADTLAGPVAEKSGQGMQPLDVDFHIAWRDGTEEDHTDTLRILDAAANRAREGLRVLEDFARFRLDDAHLTGLLKDCRHDFTGTLKNLGTDRLMGSRDTQQDVGSGISTQAESLRASPLDVVQANFKRVQEAARTLEEFGKILSPSLGDELGQLRYRLYTLEKAVLLTQTNCRRFEGCNLYLLVSEELCHHGAGPAVRESLAAGVGLVQVREKSMLDRKLVEHGKRVREWTREAQAVFIMNDRPDLAVLVDADGVHVGQEELTVREARRIVGPDRLVGVSTHTIEQARQAVLDGADYLGVGPVFASTTKQFDTLAGLELVRQVATEITLPWYAIGGINGSNLSQVMQAGASRVAVSGAICGAADPGGTARRLFERLQGAALQETTSGAS